jgi:hypothetical protein
VDFPHIILTFCAVVGFALIGIGVYAVMRGTPLHHSSTASVKFFGMEMTAVGPPVLILLGIVLVYFPISSWNKPSDSVSASPAGSAPAAAPTQTEGERLAAQTQFSKIAEIEAFLGEKDEAGLQQLFDTPNTLRKNIETQIIRIGYIREGRGKEFVITKYADNGVVIASALAIKSIDQHGIELSYEPNDVIYLVTTSQYQSTVAKLDGFINSPLVPEAIKKPLRDLNETVAKNNALMTQIMTTKMHENQDYSLRYSDMSTPFYGIIWNEFVTKMSPLKPPADEVLSAVAKAWKIDR